MRAAMKLLATSGAVIAMVAAPGLFPVMVLSAIFSSAWRLNYVYGNHHGRAELHLESTGGESSAERCGLLGSQHLHRIHPQSAPGGRIARG